PKPACLGFLSLHLRAPRNWWSGTLRPAGKLRSGRGSKPGGGCLSRGSVTTRRQAP
ncbi:unnamed protein product, partial [Arabidopsis halleri]